MGTKSEEEEVVKVKCNRSDPTASIGLELRQRNPDAPIVITGIEPGSLFDSSKLRTGLKLLRINGRCPESMVDATQIFKETTGTLCIEAAGLRAGSVSGKKAPVAFASPAAAVAAKPADELPKGWTKESKPRMSGNRMDKSWTSPEGRKFDTFLKARAFADASTANRKRIASPKGVAVPPTKRAKGRESTVASLKPKVGGATADETDVGQHNAMVVFSPSSPFSGHTNMPLQINGGVPLQIVVRPDEKPKSRSFISIWAEGRELSLAYSLSGSHSPQREFTHNRRAYSLVARKVHQEKTSIHGFANKKNVDLIYVATKGPGLSEWNLQKELEKIADFRSLAPEKAVARFDLLLTPGRHEHVWDRLTADNFEMIGEDSQQGCGFIPEGFFHDLFRNKVASTRADSLQVRIFGPSIGVSKGMLMKKSGISKIQLPPSMIKVGPSRSNHRNTWVVIVAKGVYPCESNVSLGRYMDPESDNPCKSFMQRPARPLSEMYIRLIIGLGVPRRAVMSYVRNAKTIKGLKHAHLRGVYDPSGELPADTVFVTGYSSDDASERQHFAKNSKKLFVTRSPCVEPSDGKMLRVVSSKPKLMKKDTWEWLCVFPFGHIIFSKPKEFSAPLPMLVGEGDLDGDDYFVCWDDVILKHMGSKAVKTRMHKEEDKQRRDALQENTAMKAGPCHRRGSSAWLQEAQNLMLNFDTLKQISTLTGKLYGLCTRTSDESNDGIYDKDARAFGRGFKDSLSVLKHGGQIELPSHVCEKIKPKSLHDCIQWK
jgi:hypothetical protein